MNRSFLNSVIRGAEALAVRDGVGARPDAELLRRFTADRDAAAFAVLVRRHGPLVWGVCRNLLPADADAEDAFQATFLALVRSAATVRNTEALGGWLHGVAYRVAMKARRAAARRRQRESAAAVPDRDTPVADAAWDELQAAVHEEVCKLPEKLRLPFVLCGLQGRPQKEAAKQLGWKVGTISARLTLARRRLLDRLARRGIPAAMAAGVAVLGVTSGKASVPSKLTAKVLAAAAQPDAVSPVILSLARGATQMYLTRTKILIASIIITGVLTTGIGTRALSTAEAQAPPADPSQQDLKRAIDFLRANPSSQDRWEYKFIPLDKPPTATEMKTILSTADHEGWEYCGSQELASEKRGGGATANLVFKKPRMEKGPANNRASATAALLDLARKQEADRAKEEDVARKLAEEVKARNRALFERELSARGQAAQAEKAALEAERSHARALEAALVEKNKLAKEQAVQAEKAKLEARLSRAKNDEADAANKALAEERDRAKMLEQQIQKMRMDQEKITKEVDDLRRAREKLAESTAAGGKEQTVTVPFKNADALLVAAALAKAFPNLKASVDDRSNSIVLHGSPETLKAAAELLSQIYDLKAAAPAADKIEIATIRLKNVSAADAKQAVSKHLSGQSITHVIEADESTKSLTIAGSPALIAKLKLLVAELDVAKPAK
jgi:RNA polymerase sigma factor (sigma-70 family)